ncbi:MAG: hypothetical protein ABIW83_07090 [Allosphingosinicella sp.]
MTLLKLASAVASAAMLAGAGPVVKVTPVQGSLDTGAALRLSVATAERSDAGNAAQPPFAWIDYEDTVDPAAATCDRRAERLLDSGPLQPAARDFNTIHVATLDSAGALHVLDPRNGIRGARSLAHIALGSAPSAWHWAAADGLIWVALPTVGKIVAVDVARWQITRTIDDAGAVTQLAAAGDGSLYARAPGRRLHKIGAGSDKWLEGTEGAVMIAPGEDGELWAIGESDTRRIGGGGGARTIPIALKDAAWSRRADRLIGLTGDGALVMIARSGKITPVRGMPIAASGKARLWLSPSGDVAVIHDRSASGLHVANLEQGAFARTIDADRPVSLAASDSFLFVRTEGRGETMIMPLAELAKADGGGPRWVAGGEPVSPTRSGAALTVSPDGLSAWADAERNLIYLYHEGMNIPSGTLRNPGPAPERLLLVGPTIRPVGAGRFEAGFRLERPGRYVAVVVGTQPRFVQCTAFEVRGLAQLSPDERETRVTLAASSHEATTGETVPIRFTLEGGGDMPSAVGVLIMDVSGVGMQQRIRARSLGNGTFEAAVTITRAGTFLVMPDPVTLPAKLAGRPVATIRVTQ